MSAKAVLTPTTRTPAVASSSSLAPFLLAGSDGALPAVGGLDLSLGAAGERYPAFRGPVKDSTNCVQGEEWADFSIPFSGRCIGQFNGEKCLSPWS